MQNPFNGQKIFGKLIYQPKDIIRAGKKVNKMWMLVTSVKHSGH